jgi:hypothetical protein
VERALQEAEQKGGGGGWGHGTHVKGGRLSAGSMANASWKYSAESKSLASSGWSSRKFHTLLAPALRCETPFRSRRAT